MFGKCLNLLSYNPDFLMTQKKNPFDNIVGNEENAGNSKEFCVFVTMGKKSFKNERQG